MRRIRRETVNSLSSMMAEIVSSRLPLVFRDEDLIHGNPNKHTPMVVRATMANYEVRRIMVNQGDSFDLIFLGMLTILGILEEDLASYRRTDLFEFNGARTIPP